MRRCLGGLRCLPLTGGRDEEMEGLYSLVSQAWDVGNFG